ncbi:MOSC domain-containing protein [Actinoplanes sp. NPDC004185]
MKVLEIRRYPIKSLLGERPTAVEVEQRGLAGDRLWAVRDTEGKLGSGKNTRRFRRMPGLFRLRGHFADPVPVVELPDGRRFAADDPAGHRAVSEVLGRPVTITREAEVVHHDEGPVSVISTAALRRLRELTGEEVDPLRFRANLLIDVPGTGFPEEEWLGRNLRIGDQVVLRPRRRLTRCVMIDLAQEGVPEHGRLLRTVAEHHDLTFGVWATVERAGRIELLDDTVPDPM